MVCGFYKISPSVRKGLSTQLFANTLNINWRKEEIIDTVKISENLCFH